MSAPPSRTWRALGTTARVVTRDADALEVAAAAVAAVLDEVDLACSRFRQDSELSRLNGAGGAPTRVSPLLARALRCALRAAAVTDGDLDPTIGGALVAAGYDRDFATVRAGAAVRFVPAGGWRSVHLDETGETVRLDRGVQLDLGATAKALAADLAAAAAAACADGVLVSLGGDVALAGTPPAAGWAVRVSDDHTASPRSPGETIALRSGGLATSTTSVRRWLRGEREVHHILDPHSGAPVDGPWRTVSVAAATCLEANIASTASIVRGAEAPEWLIASGLPARLVAHDGTVTRLAGWPEPLPEAA